MHNVVRYIVLRDSCNKALKARMNYKIYSLVKIGSMSCCYWLKTTGRDSKVWPFNCHFQLQGSARSRDDLDMEQALKPRGQNTPDVIRSAIDKNDSGIATIDNLFGAPEKIVIPERYIPDTVRASFKKIDQPPASSSFIFIFSHYIEK